MATMEKPETHTLVSEATPAKKGWSLKKKLALAGIVLIIVIGLAVGLGVGLTVGRSGGGGDDDDGDDDSNDDNGDGAPRRTETWKPEVAAPWQITLIKTMDLKTDLIPDVDIYDLDLYDNSAETFSALHDRGKKVICYFSAGSWEKWRDDADDFDDDDLGSVLDGWPDEKWVNLSSPKIRDIMAGRVALAARKGCDAIDPDNIDAFQNDNGLGLTANDSISFLQFMAKEARSHKLAIGLKNGGDIIRDVLDDMDFSVNEQCAEYSECSEFAAFIDDGKPVFHIEYPTEKSWSSVVCSRKGKGKGSDDFSTVFKNMDLDFKVEYCDGETYD